MEAEGTRSLAESTDRGNKVKMEGGVTQMEPVKGGTPEELMDGNTMEELVE